MTPTRPSARRPARILPLLALAPLLGVACASPPPSETAPDPEPPPDALSAAFDALVGQLRAVEQGVARPEHAAHGDVDLRVYEEEEGGDEPLHGEVEEALLLLFHSHLSFTMHHY